MRRLSAAGIQSAFQFYNINSFETVERLIRRGVYKGPLVMNWVAIGGGMDQPNDLQPGQLPARHPRRRDADGGKQHAQRAADQHDGHGDGPARALRHRGQPLEPVAHRQDDDGAADRAAGAHLARVRPRGRHRQGSARDLQDRRLLRHRRRDAGRQRLRAQPPRAASRASCARPPEGTWTARAHRPDRPRACATRRAALADPARPASWRACAACRRWAARTWTAPRAWLPSSARRRRSTGPSDIVAHSGGCIMVAHWAAQTRRAVHGALLATPPDFDQPMPEGYPTLAALARRRLAAGAARAPAVPQHRRRQPQRPAGPFDRVARTGARLGQRARRPGQGRPPEPGLGLRRLAAGR